MTSTPASQARRAALVQRGLWLEYTTLGWNVVGCIIVIAAAIAARLVALAGFGLDSVIEIFASVVVVWQLTGAARHTTPLPAGEVIFQWPTVAG